MGSSNLEQTNALFRKNIVIQRRARKTNCCLIFFPLIICGAIGGLQITIDRQIAKEQREHPIVVDCSCNNAVVSGNSTGGAVCLDSCPLPRAPKWPPVLQIPSPSSSNPFFYDGGASCSAGAAAPGSCAARFLVTGTNQSFVSSVMDNMIPVQSTSVNVSADDISALADFVLANRYYMQTTLFDPPGVNSFLQNTCTPNLTLSYAYIEGNETVSQDVNCTEGLMLWRDNSWLISDELYKAYYGGNKTNEIAAAYDFLSSDLSNFNLVISYNSTNKFGNVDTGISIIQLPGPWEAPRLRQVPRLTNMASSAYLHLRGNALKISFDFVKDMPRAAKSFSFDISSIIGQLPYLWTMMLLFPVILTNLVYEKQNKLRIMMKMHGLGDLPYWTITYSYFILLSMLYMLSFMIFGVALRISFFRLNNYDLQFVFYFAYMNLQISFAFLVATCFSNVRTATVTGYFYIFGSGLIAEFFFKPYIEDIFLSGSWIILLELFPPFSLYRIVYELSQSALLVSVMGSTGMQWSDLSDTKNGMRSVLTIMIFEWILFMSLSFYLDHFGSFQNGIRKAVLLLHSHRAAKQSSAAQQQTMQVQEFKASVEMERTDVIKEREIVGQLLQEPNRSYSVICDNLKKVYRGKDGNSKKIAVRELSLSMARGQCFGVLGPNGAGKTTLINMLTGFTKPTSGTAYIEGMDIRLDMDKIYSGIGVCPQHDLLWETLTGKEHLLFYGRLKKLKGTQLAQAIKQSLKSVRLFEGGVADKLVAKYSGGMKRRLSVAISLIGDPKVVYMDEPSSGLDPASRKDLWNAVKSAKQDRAIILTTHSMEEAEVLCDRIGIIANGTLQCIGNSKELKTKYGGSYVLTITTAAGEEAEEVEKLVQSISPGVSRVYHISGTQKFEMPKQEVRISDVFHAMENAKSRVTILAWGLADTTLEDVFIRVARESEASSVCSSS
ncbi:ABC transporter A family member 8 isoform X1 [Lolium perenne]|uniref:ABC transporter A family member 8 isoform X1 n=1 Tax=Lolium perenne TaxID=4522 RepID=UPI0021F59192|nr:ABC transporter A family member 8-like isoform X1 [Lolium perenne]